MLKKNHDCKEVVDQVNLLIDGELNAKEEQDVLCELQRCMHCLDEFNLQKKFKDFMQIKLEKKNIPTACIERIKNQIASTND
jgi:hypothetical protein